MSSVAARHIDMEVIAPIAIILHLTPMLIAILLLVIAFILDGEGFSHSFFLT